MFRPRQQKPDKGRNVDISHMDPETLARYYAAQSHPLIRWATRWVSAGRTRAKQAFLYRMWKLRKPGYNLAADPDWARPDGSRGSRHMVQFTGYSYALDLAKPAALPWKAVHRAFKPFGLRFTVPGENWHCQALKKFSGGKPVYWPVDPRNEPEVEKWRKIIAGSVEAVGGLAAAASFIADSRRLILRRGDDSPSVALAQKLLNSHTAAVPNAPDEPGPLAVDGKFGTLTTRAVVRFQNREGLNPDGVIGKSTWSALLDGG